MMYSIRIGMRTQVEINGKKFTMRILEGNKFDLNQPGYTCQCDSDSSEIEDNPTNAITSLYRQIFKTQTKISGSMVMGFDKDSIFTELLQDIEFRPYSISIADKLTIMVFSLGASKKESWLGAGEGYMASFIHIFRKERCIFVQKFIKNKSIVEVWNNSTKISHYEGSQIQTYFAGVFTGVSATKNVRFRSRDNLDYHLRKSKEQPRTVGGKYNTKKTCKDGRDSLILEVSYNDNDFFDDGSCYFNDDTDSFDDNGGDSSSFVDDIPADDINFEFFDDEVMER
ncbi:unnamed protein product [Rhizophagus irregularis]|nr:unnamed protein product [Rhizophagus irregularis]